MAVDMRGVDVLPRLGVLLHPLAAKLLQSAGDVAADAGASIVVIQGAWTPVNYALASPTFRGPSSPFPMATRASPAAVSAFDSGTAQLHLAGLGVFVMSDWEGDSGRVITTALESAGWLSTGARGEFVVDVVRHQATIVNAALQRDGAHGGSRVEAEGSPTAWGRDGSPVTPASPVQAAVQLAFRTLLAASMAPAPASAVLALHAVDLAALVALTPLAGFGEVRDVVCTCSAGPSTGPLPTVVTATAMNKTMSGSLSGCKVAFSVAQDPWQAPQPTLAVYSAALCTAVQRTVARCGAVSERARSSAPVLVSSKSSLDNICVAPANAGGHRVENCVQMPVPCMLQSWVLFPTVFAGCGK